MGSMESDQIQVFRAQPSHTGPSLGGKVPNLGSVKQNPGMKVESRGVSGWCKLGTRYAGPKPGSVGGVRWGCEVGL